MAVISNVGDKFLWTVVLTTGIAAYWYIPYFLTYAKELAAIPPQSTDNTKPQLQKAAEDAIDNSTLAELANGPSYNLAASAIRLTASRVVKTGVKLQLLDDLQSKSWQHRDRAITGLDLLIFDPALRENITSMRRHFTNKTTFEAIVEALVNEQDENKERNTGSQNTFPSSPLRPAYRSAHERYLIDFLLFLIEAPRYPSDYYTPLSAECALEAGLITRWLANYPFPCALPENAKFKFKKSDVCRLLSEEVWNEDDTRMSRLVQKLQRVPGGLKQLTEAGLRLASFDDDVQDTLQPRPRSHPQRSQNTFGLSDLDDDDEEGEIGQLINDEDLMDRLRGDSARQSSAEQTPEERSLRRRHRNAVVVAEPGSPLRPENILQRQITESDIERLITESDIERMLAPEIPEPEVDPEGHISVARLMEGRSLDEIDGIALGEFGPRAAALPPELLLVPLDGSHEASDAVESGSYEHEQRTDRSEDNE